MEWKEIRLGDILNFRRGHDLPHSKMIAGKIPVAGSNGIIGYHNVATPVKPLLTIGRSGNIGTPYIYETAWAHNTTLYIDDFKGNHPLFLYYLCKILPFANFQAGSAVPTLNRNHIHQLIVKYPPNYTDQSRIASILSSLDSKIETNNKINAKLEEMAQALFKSWFVDFEPFKDKGMVESELGMIPEGWRVGYFEDIIEDTISGDWGKEDLIGNYTHSVACIRGCDFQDMKNGVRGNTPQRFILEKNFNNKKMQDKDIIVEISGGTATVSTGRICYVNNELLTKYDNDIVCTNFCRVIRPQETYSAYIYYSWQFKYDKKVMFGYENGTSGIKNFSLKDFIAREPVLLPSEDVAKSFQEHIELLRKQIQLNGSENTRLSLLRDTLLPKLMSGEIEL